MKLLASLFLASLLVFLALPAVQVFAEDAPTTDAGGGGFVGLTSIPAFQGITASTGIASFLNNIYKIAIGVAAILAILQITRAGIEYMGGDSITEKKHAKDLLWKSLLGLLLVLSPAIVYGIIDPRILTLNVGVSALQPSSTGQTDASGLPVCEIDGQTFPPIQSGTVISEAQRDCCTGQGFHVVQNQGGMVCQQNAPVADPRAQPGATGQEVIGGTTYYYHNFPAPLGTAVLLLTKINSTETPACLALAFKNFPDQATCRAEAPGIQSSHAGWSVGANCTAPSTDHLNVQSQRPLCTPIEDIP